MQTCLRLRRGFKFGREGGKSHQLTGLWQLPKLMVMLLITRCSTSSFPWRGDRELKFPKQEKKIKEGKKKINNLPVQPRMAAPGVAARGNVLPLGTCCPLLFHASGSFPVKLPLHSMPGLCLSTGCAENPESPLGCPHVLRGSLQSDSLGTSAGSRASCSLSLE